VLYPIELRARERLSVRFYNVTAIASFAVLQILKHRKGTEPRLAIRAPSLKQLAGNMRAGCKMLPPHNPVVAGRGEPQFAFRKRQINPREVIA
jgi:hypothetical protein